MKTIITTFCTLLLAGLGSPAAAQEPVAAPSADAWRTNTWSLYLQGGMSWAGGVEMQNVNAPAGTGVAALYGLGANYNIRPWVRLGLNYETTRVKRQQRFKSLQPLGPMLDLPGMELIEHCGGRAFTDLWSRLHNLDLTAEFNIMELWKNRSGKRFNLYGGAGVGVAFAHGNTYDLSMGYERWGKDVPGASEYIHTWLHARNERHGFTAFYVPLALAAEYDVLPRLTVGARFGYKFLCSSDRFAPDNVGSLALTLRYNILGRRQGYRSDRRKLAEMAAEFDAYRRSSARAQEECDRRRADASAEAEELRTRLRALEAEQARLKEAESELARLKALEAGRLAQTAGGLDLQFRFDSAKLSGEQRARLDDFLALAGSDASFEVVGEASDTGDGRYNQLLSERRMEHVLKLLAARGVAPERIRSATAIGSSARIDDDIACRVTVRVVR